jgi:hypothetical protein
VLVVHERRLRVIRIRHLTVPLLFQSIGWRWDVDSHGDDEEQWQAGPRALQSVHTSGCTIH